MEADKCVRLPLKESTRRHQSNERSLLVDESGPAGRVYHPTASSEIFTWLALTHYAVMSQEATQSLSHHPPHHIVKPGRYVSVSVSLGHYDQGYSITKPIEFGGQLGRAQCESIHHSWDQAAGKWWQAESLEVYYEDWSQDWHQHDWVIFFFSSGHSR